MATDLPTNEQILQVLRDQLETRRKINEEMSKQASISNELKASLEAVPTRDDITNSLRNMTGAIDEASKKANKAAKKDKKDKKKQITDWRDLTVAVGKYTFKLGTAVQMAKQMGTAFTGTFSAGLNMFMGLVGGAFQLGKAILSIPFKMFDFFFKMAQKGGGGGELRQAYNDVRKEFGDLASNEGAAVIKMAKGMLKESRNLAYGGRRASNAFGRGKKGLAAALKHAVEIMKEAKNALAILAPTFADLGAQAFRATKALGMTSETMMNVALEARQTGKDTKDAFDQVIRSVSKLSKRLGTNVRFVTKIYSQLKNNLVNFAYASQAELERTTAAIVKLGVESKALDDVISRFETLESATEFAAKSAQMFGIHIDAVDMMRLADESPVDAMMKLRESFLASGQSFADLSRGQRKYYADMLGMDMGDVMKLMDPTTSLTEMQDAMDGGKDKTESMDQILKKLGKSIDRLIGAMGSFGKSFTEIFINGIFKGLRRGKNFRKILKSFKTTMVLVDKAGIAVGKTLDYLFSPTGPFGNLVKGLNGLVGKGKGIEKVFKGIGDALVKFFDTLDKNPRKAIEDLFNGLQTAISDGLGEETMNDLTLGFTDLMNKIGLAMMDGLPFLATKISEGLTQMTGYLSGEVAMPDKAQTLGDAFVLMLTRVFKGLKDAGSILAPHLRDALAAIGRAALPYLIPVFATLFALSLAKALLVGAIAGVGKAMAGGLLKKFSKAMPAKAVGGEQSDTSAGAISSAGDNIDKKKWSPKKAGKKLRKIIIHFLPPFTVFLLSVMALMKITSKLAVETILKGTFVLAATTGMLAAFTAGSVVLAGVKKEAMKQAGKNAWSMIKTYIPAMAALILATGGLMKAIEAMKIDYAGATIFMALFSVFMGNLIAFAGTIAGIAYLQKTLPEGEIGKATLYMAALAAGIGLIMIGVGKLVEHLGTIKIENPKTVYTVMDITATLINQAVKMVLAVAVSVNLIKGAKRMAIQVAIGLAAIGAIAWGVAKFAKKTVPELAKNIKKSDAQTAMMVAQTVGILVDSTIKLAFAALPMGLLAMAPFPANLIAGGAIIAGLRQMMSMVEKMAEMMPPLVKKIIESVPNESPEMLKAKSAVVGTILSALVEVGKMIAAIAAAAPKKQDLFTSETESMGPIIEELSLFLVGDGTTMNQGLFPTIEITITKILDAMKGLTEPQIKAVEAGAALIDAVTNMLSSFSRPLAQFKGVVVQGVLSEYEGADTASQQMSRFGRSMEGVIGALGTFVKDSLGGFIAIVHEIKFESKAEAKMFLTKMEAVAMAMKAVSMIVSAAMEVGVHGDSSYTENRMKNLSAAKKSMTKYLFKKEPFPTESKYMTIVQFLKHMKGLRINPKHAIKTMDAFYKFGEAGDKFFKKMKKLAFYTVHGGMTRLHTPFAMNVAQFKKEYDILQEGLSGIGEGVDINEKMKLIGQALSIKKENIEIQHKPFSVRMNLKVTMDVRDIAKPLVDGNYFFVDGTEAGTASGAKLFLKKNPLAFKPRA